MMAEKAIQLAGYEKAKKACFVAAADGFEYIWIDTCSIDKTSSAELSEVLNSCIVGTKKPQYATHFLQMYRRELLIP